MNLSVVTTEKNCPRAEMAAYLDGELSAAEESALEAHAADCKDCLAELNLQKQLLRALDSAFDKKAEIELPENFARIVATRAETSVSGLRTTEEKFRALFLCALLFLIIVAGLGAETGDTFAAFGKFGEQFVAVAGFAAHLVYDLSIGATVILHSLGGQFVFGSTLSFILLIASFALSALMLSRLILRFHRS